MARYDSNQINQPGQYPTTTWGLMGLPEQNFGTGAPGTMPQSGAEDPGGTNEPGQYPPAEGFTGVPLDGTGAPGTQGIAGGAGGGDSVTYDDPTFYKGQHGISAGGYDDDGAGPGAGYKQNQASVTVAGRGDWTQANSQGYQADAQYQMPGTAGNTPAPGDGGTQTDGQDGSPHVMYGGWLKGKRPATSKHVSGSGPGS